MLQTVRQAGSGAQPCVFSVEGTKRWHIHIRLQTFHWINLSDGVAACEKLWRKSCTPKNRYKYCNCTLTGRYAISRITFPTGSEIFRKTSAQSDGAKQLVVELGFKEESQVCRCLSVTPQLLHGVH